MQDMTKGSIACHLIRYAIPMILGNIMQLTYNAVDSVIIGKILGKNALAAVSTSNPVMTIMILGASGIGIGAGVIMSRLYGGGDLEGLRREFCTTLVMGTILSLMIFGVGILSAGHILRLINTPVEIMPMAVRYLRIIFVGFLFSFQFNILSHAMRSIGDSKTPTVFLGISCGLNVLLDLLFVGVLGFGVTGAAVATVCSQGMSVVLCSIRIRNKVTVLRLSLGEVVVDRKLLLETAQSGALTALQQAAQPIGKVVIQSVINAQGTIAMGAFNAVCRVDDFACIPAQSMGSGTMTCTAQNRGARNSDRVWASFKWGLVIAICYYPVICGLTLMFKEPIVRLLCPGKYSQMVLMGVTYLSVKAWVFILACVNNAIQGFFRGMGRMSIVLVATVMQISIRAFCVTLWVPRIGITGEAYGCLVGWSCQLIFETICLIILRKRMEEDCIG